MPEYIADNDIKIGVITTPREQAQSIADQMVDSGIMSIWNFAPIDVKVPEGVVVENVHLSDSLYILSYKMNDLERQES
jgi:redox-sensing transcriptional repressor